MQKRHLSASSPSVSPGLRVLLLPLLLVAIGACEGEPPQADLLSVTAPSRESPWLASERQRFFDILSESTADVLVVPFQTAGYGFDSAERTLLASRISAWISARTELSVADPLLVGRALGEGWRRLDNADIRTLATAMQASHVVIGEVGHDRNSMFRVTVRTWSSVSPGDFDHDVTSAKQSWDLEFTDEQFPHQVFTGQLPAVAHMLQLDVGQPTAPASAQTPSAGDTGLPEFDQLLEPSVVSARRLHALQLIALTYPWTPDRPVERAWVRTLDLAYRQPAGAPDRNLVIARALAHLGRRPAALTLLADARTAAERSLREFLNGNLPQGEREAAAIEDPVQRLIAHVELGDLRWAYGHTSRDREEEALSRFVAKDSPWWPILRSKVTSRTSGWVTAYLARFFPLSEPGWEGVRDRVEWLWDDVQFPPDMGDFDVAVAATALEYYNQWIVDHAPELTGEGMHGTWLLLDLIAARVEVRIFDDIGHTWGMPGRIGVVREEIARAARYFDGHPDIAALQAQVEWKEHDRYLGAEQARWLAAALRDTEDAFYWAQGISLRLLSTDHQAPDLPIVRERLEHFREAYFWDLPGDIHWLPVPFRKDERAWMHYRDTVLGHTVWKMAYVKWLMEFDKDERRVEEVREALQGRFTGNPAVAQFHAQALWESGDLRAAEEAYRAAVAQDSAPYGTYDYLAQVLIEQGRYADAFEAVGSYPGFEPDSGGNAYNLSAHAEFAAMLFWRIGQFDYARPLLELSAGYDTSSSASMTSRAILAQDRGDYRTAAQIRMNQARRYRDFDALNDYLDFSFALGDFGPAWAVFEEVRRDGNGGELLRRLVLDVRAEGWTDRQVRDWLSEDRIRNLENSTFRYAAHAAVSAFVVDREPPDDLAELVRELQDTSPYFMDSDGNVALRNPEDRVKQEGAICGPSEYGSGSEPSQGEPVESHLVYFTTAYLALEAGDYAKAQALLEEAASLFDYFASYCENVTYLFPYLALAAASNDDTNRLTRYLDSIAFERRRTNYHLTRAAIAGIVGREQEALQSLDTALHRWKGYPYNAVPTRYVYADICRRLYELTGSVAYRDRLLSWLRVHQRWNPADSWAYAMEARFAPDPVKKQRALALTLLLDPNSPALKKASQDELTSARGWLIRNNPFGRDPASGGASAGRRH